MRRFSFRLATVLRVRLRAEEAKKTEFAIAHRNRVLAEQDEQRLRAQMDRVALLELPPKPDTLRQRELYQQLMEDRIEAQRHLVALLVEKEQKAKEVWLAARRDVQVLERLRDKALERHEREAARLAQREPDEWAILRAGVTQSAG